MKKFALKGLAILLAVMFVCTLISKAADSLTVAKVTVETAGAKKIEHTVEADGSVEKNRELAVLTEADLLVKTVYVSVGESVKENALLAEVDLSQLDQTILETKNEIRGLQLQNSQAKQSESDSTESKQRMQNRAKEDYNRTVQQHTQAVQKAQQELQQAKEALNSYEKQLQSTEKTLGQMQNTETDQKEEGDTEKADASEAKGEQSGQTDAAQLQNLQSEVARTKEAYDTAVSSYQQAILEAQRQQEDTDSTKVSQDASVEINEMSIKEKQKKLSRLEKLREAEGKITAPVAGVITQCILCVGQKTSDTAAFTMADISSGMRFVAQITQENSKYVQVGDAVTLKVTGNSIPDLKVEAIEKAQEGDNLNVTVLLPAGALSIGDSATMCVTKQSEMYNAVVPYTAIHTEDNKNYVYVASKEQTILGTEYIARKFEVEILEKNDRYAALAEQGMDWNEKIIIDSDRYIEAGSRVRLQNP